MKRGVGREVHFPATDLSCVWFSKSGEGCESQPRITRRISGASERGHDKVRKTGDGLGTLNTEEMNGPRLRPMAH